MNLFSALSIHMYLCSYITFLLMSTPQLLVVLSFVSVDVFESLCWSLHVLQKLNLVCDFITLFI